MTKPNQQPPETLLRQLERNLKPVEEVVDTKIRSARAREQLKTKGFEDLQHDLNRLESDAKGLELFVDEDFEGARVYLDTAAEQEYTRKHRLPPLSFGVFFPPEKWDAIVRKLQLDPECGTGHSLDACFFSDSRLGLEKTGITLHVDRGLPTDAEFEILYHDGQFYSRTHPLAKRLTQERLTTPLFAIQTVEHLLLTDLCARRADGLRSDELRARLTERLDLYIDYIPAWIGARQRDWKEVREAYSKLFEELRSRISPAVDTVVALDKSPGTSYLTLFMFALGSTPEELERNHLLSPLLGLQYLREYLADGRITTEQVDTILKQKGY